MKKRKAIIDAEWKKNIISGFGIFKWELTTKDNVMMDYDLSGKWVKSKAVAENDMNTFIKINNLKNFVN